MDYRKKKISSVLSLPIPNTCVSLLCVSAVTNYHKLCNLKQEKLFSHSSGGQKSETGRALFPTEALGEDSIPTLVGWGWLIGLKPYQHNLCFCLHITSSSGGLLQTLPLSYKDAYDCI